MKNYDVVVVGAGPAGLGVAIALIQAGVQRFTVLERNAIGASFLRWPREMRFITPSFDSAAYGQPDLNAIHPMTSPAFSLSTEHPTGVDYARYLKMAAGHFEVPVKTGIEVSGLKRSREKFEIATSKGTYRSRFVVWALGEFQYPRRNGIPGAEIALHNSSVSSWKDLSRLPSVIIGAYESGTDAAIHIAELGQKVTLFDAADRWTSRSGDPSEILSPYTRERLAKYQRMGLVEMVAKRVEAITSEDSGYLVYAGGQTYRSEAKPILATGFDGGLRLIEDAFDWNNGDAVVNEQDESTRVSGLFLAGPQLRHVYRDKKIIFCFIYKFRGRFPVVAQAIGQRLGLDTAPLDAYRKSNMFLDDLSCCAESCAC